jgi:hypothetical protein
MGNHLKFNILHTKQRILALITISHSGQHRKNSNQLQKFSAIINTCK